MATAFTTAVVGIFLFVVMFRLNDYKSSFAFAGLMSKSRPGDGISVGLLNSFRQLLEQYLSTLQYSHLADWVLGYSTKFIQFSRGLFQVSRIWLERQCKTAKDLRTDNRPVVIRNGSLQVHKTLLLHTLYNCTQFNIA